MRASARVAFSAIVVERLRWSCLEKVMLMPKQDYLDFSEKQMAIWLAAGDLHTATPGNDPARMVPVITFEDIGILFDCLKSDDRVFPGVATYLLTSIGPAMELEGLKNAAYAYNNTMHQYYKDDNPEYYQLHDTSQSQQRINMFYYACIILQDARAANKKKESDNSYAMNLMEHQMQAIVQRGKNLGVSNKEKLNSVVTSHSARLTGGMEIVQEQLLKNSTSVNWTFGALHRRGIPRHHRRPRRPARILPAPFRSRPGRGPYPARSAVSTPVSEVGRWGLPCAASSIRRRCTQVARSDVVLGIVVVGREGKGRKGKGRKRKGREGRGGVGRKK
jgi:hypothetical protein